VAAWRGRKDASGDETRPHRRAVHGLLLSNETGDFRVAKHLQLCRHAEDQRALDAETGVVGVAVDQAR